MVGPIDMKLKVSASAGYWVIYVTLNFYLNCDFKVKFWNSFISGIVGLTVMEQRGSKSIGCWADYVTLPFMITYDIGSEWHLFYMGSSLIFELMLPTGVFLR